MVFSRLAGSGQVHASYLEQGCFKHFAMVSLTRQTAEKYTSLGLMSNNPYDERHGDDDSLFPPDSLSTNCRLMLLSGTRTVRVIGLTGAEPGSGCTSKWIKIWKGRKKAITVVGLAGNGYY